MLAPQPKTHQTPTEKQITTSSMHKAGTNAAALTRPPIWTAAWGDRPPATLFSPANGIQAKLEISQLGDPYEQEADRVAEQMMRMPEESQSTPQKNGCAGCTADASCPECADEKKTLARRKTEQLSEIADASVPDDFLQNLGPGQPLDMVTRALMEPRYGHDFSQVRIHADPKAARSAQAVNALAYTVGRDVVFGAGQYSPQSSAGMRLMAHELTHVVQQGGWQHYGAKSPVGNPADVLEQEANEVAAATAQGSAPKVGERMNAAHIQKAFIPPSKTVPFTGPEAQVRIVIQRDTETPQATLGTLTIGDHHLDVLELPWRNNAHDTSRIPAGTYPAHIRTDGHLGWRIELENTGPRTNIEIHIGNIPGESLGCILPGTARGPNRVFNSGDARHQIQQEVTKAGHGARIEVIIRDPLPLGPGGYPLPSSTEKAV